MKIDIPYYSDNTRISNSAIGWFLKKGPQYLKDMLDGKEQGISGSFLERGTMIHMYILQPNEFWDEYEILDFEAPKVSQQKSFCEAYANLLETNPLEDIKSLKLQAYRMSYSNNKTDIQALSDAEKLVETYENYLSYLKIGSKKKVISFSDFNMLKTIKKNIMEHTAANELLFDVPTTYNCHNEFHINWEVPKYKVNCKSLLDRVMFDHVNKKVILIDIKTTSDIYNFKHSVEEYDYYRQIAYYILALTWYMQEELNLNIDDYDLETYIVAVQTNGNFEVRVFDMLNEEELLSRKALISDTLSEISYHISTDNWEHTRKYYENNGIEKL